MMWVLNQNNVNSFLYWKHVVPVLRITSNKYSNGLFYMLYAGALSWDPPLDPEGETALWALMREKKPIRFKMVLKC